MGLNKACCEDSCSKLIPKQASAILLRLLLLLLRPPIQVHDFYTALLVPETSATGKQLSSGETKRFMNPNDEALVSGPLPSELGFGDVFTQSVSGRRGNSVSGQALYFQ